MEGEDDEEDDEEDGPDVENMTKCQIILKASIILAFGTFVIVAFSDPMVDAIDHFSDAIGIPNFYVSFIITPFASNASELIASIYFCAKKSSKNVSLAYYYYY